MSSTDPARLRVLTWNLYGPDNPDWDRRHRLAAELIQEVDPDVLALQEVPTSTGFVHDLLGAPYQVAAFPTGPDGVGGVVATRTPHRVVDEIDLRITERVRAALTWTATVIIELESPVGPVVVAHHKPTWPFPFELEREQQAVIAARAIERHVGSRDVHAVVLGDFDATPDSASMQFWRGRKPSDGLSVCYQDAWEYVHGDDPGWTFETSNPLVASGEVATAVSRKIDHILVRSVLHGPTLRVADCRRVGASPVDGIWASDHYGVVADLVLPDQRPGFRS